MAAIRGCRWIGYNMLIRSVEKAPAFVFVVSFRRLMDNGLQEERRNVVGESERNGVSSHGALSHARSLGYSEEEIESVPQGVACRGCGNPTALAELREGETVLDLGCGAGLDALLAAQRVGPTGRVIGVDASAEAVTKAKEHAVTGGYRNIEFRVGQRIALLVEDESVDVVISNCVINSKEVAATFREIFRCLKPGGRMLVADLVIVGNSSCDVLSDPLWGEWIADAVEKQDYMTAIVRAGFRNAAVIAERPFDMAEEDERLRGKIVSIQVSANK